MSLIERISDSFALKFAKNISDKEKKLRDLLNDAHKLIGLKLYPNQVNWERYEQLKTNILDLILKYDGQFKKCFTYSFKRLKEEEKSVMGYTKATSIFYDM